MPKQRYQFTASQIKKARQLWKQGYPQHAVCRAIGCTRYAFEGARQRGVFKDLPKRPKGGKGVQWNKNGKPPTPAQIKAECKKIQQSWTGQETKERWVGLPFNGPIE